VNPNAMMLSAISRICLAECVLGLCGFGLIRRIEISWTVMLFCSMTNPGAAESTFAQAFADSLNTLIAGSFIGFPLSRVRLLHALAWLGGPAEGSTP
jgi:hypothetical protein